MDMKAWILLYLLFMPIGVSLADPGETACVQFHRALSAIPHQENEVVPASFEFNNRTYGAVR